jgi:hypothetical protein
MNTTGYIRGYMAKNMNAEDFIKVVVKALSREFEEEVQLKNINDGFIIRMKDYKIIISKELIDKLKSSYKIDRFILEEFENQGFNLDRNRSQYIQYCFGNYVGTK